MLFNSKPTNVLAVRLLTDLGWVRGHLALQHGATLVDQLDHNDGVLRLLDVAIPSRHQTTPFMVVRVDAIRIAVIDGAERQRSHRKVSNALQPASLLLENYTVNGHVDLGIEQRLSDVFTERHAFIHVKTATLFTEMRAGVLDELGAFPDVYVNVKRVRAACEVGSTVRPEERTSRIRQSN